MPEPFAKRTRQRAKLRPEAMEAVLKDLNFSISCLHTLSDYRFLAYDGSNFPFSQKI